jgi:transcriptional regulator with PAS, ATPase and Fis domain
VAGISGIRTQAIHLNSHRSEKPFIKINCPAIPTDFLESELFGFERGAFTGAHLEKPGLVLITFLHAFRSLSPRA